MMKPDYFNLLFVGLCLLLFWPSLAQARQDKFRLIVREDPAHQMTIGWDQRSGSNPVVYYGKVDQGRNYSLYPFQQSPDRTVSFKGMDNYFVRLSNLEPNTAYYFVVRDSEGLSQRYWFKTLPDHSGERLSIVAGGDSRRSDWFSTSSHDPRVRSNQMVAKLRPHLVVFGGDYTNTGTNGQWKSWFNDWQHTITADGRLTPILPARGNHELSNEVVQRLFDVKDDNITYAVNLGGNLMRIYTLNSLNAISGSQTEWLAQDLAEHQDQVVWKMAQYHYPIAPHNSGKSYQTSQYSNWANLFYEYGVNLAVECDAHVVKTTWPLRPDTGSDSEQGFVRDDQRGIVFLGEGSWGITRSNDRTYGWTRDSDSFTQFKWIWVDSTGIEARTVKTASVEQVAYLTEDSLFTLPKGIEIWEPSNGSVVYIEKKDTAVPPIFTGEIAARVFASEDDAEESWLGTMYLTSSDLELVYDGWIQGEQKIGMRFQNLYISQGAIITEAYLQFTVDETNNRKGTLTIAGEAIGNAPAFVNANGNISKRSLTQARIQWKPASWNRTGEAGLDQRTPDLSGIVQEIVHRADWEAGHHLAIIIKGSGRRTAEAYDGVSSKAPLLVVKYELPRAQSKGSSPEEDHSEEALKIYANPFLDRLKIGITSEDPSDGEIFIYDRFGRLVHRQRLQGISGDWELDLASLRSGTYLLRAELGAQTYTRRIIKK